VRRLIVLAMVGCVHRPPVSDPAPACATEVGATSITDAGGTSTVDRDATIATVRLAGASPALTATLSKFIETKPGDTLARATIAEDIRRLWAVGVLTDIHVDTSAGEGGAALTFVVTPQPLIDRVLISGEAEHDPDLRRMRALAGAPFEPMRVSRMASAIEQSMIYEGYPDAKIHVNRAIGGVGLCVRAKRGPHVTIRKLGFEGNALIPDSVLLEQLRGNEKSGINRPGGIFDEAIMSEDSYKLTGLYYDRGKPMIKIGDPRTERHGNTIDVTIPITEGATYYLSKITVGALDGISRDTLGLAPGEPFSRERIRAAVELLEKRTDPDSWINPETAFDTVHHTLDLHFAITWRHAWQPLRLLPRR
jgi:outer membrane protein insertion porin family